MSHASNREARVSLKLVVAAVGASILLAALLWSTQGMRRTPAPLPVQVPPEVSTDQESASLEGLTADAVRENADASVEATEQVEATVDFQEPLTDGRQVLVVAQDDGRALAGAALTFIAETEEEALVSARGSYLRLVIENSEDPETESNEYGVRYRADENGRLFIPPGPGLLMGRAGDLWSLIELPKDELETVRLELEPDTSIRIRVVDHERMPVGGVQVAVHHEPEMDSFLDFTRTSDPTTGEVLFPHLGWSVRHLAEGLFGRPGQLGHFVITPIIHARTTPRYLVDPTKLPSETVELALGPTGSILIQLTGSTVTLPLRDGFKTDLLETRMADENERSQVNWMIPIQDVDSQGFSLYPHVGLGLEFDALVRLESGEDWHETRIKGPRVAGECVVVQVEIPDNYPIMVLRITDEAGEPLAETLCDFSIRSSDSSILDEERVKSDKNGMIRAHFERNREGWFGTRVNVLARVNASPVPRRTSFEWDSPSHGGLVDLGDRALQPAPLLASGIVIGTDGSPIKYASLEAQSSTLIDGHERHETIPGSKTASTSEGTFRVYGFTDDSTVGLTVFAWNFIAHRIHRVRQGAEDLVITLRSTGSLSGRVLVDSLALAAAIEVYLHRTSPNEPGSGQSSEVRDTFTFLTDSGSFLLGGLMPGTYDLRILLTDSAEELVAIEDLEVLPGERCRDPKIAAIKLPDLMHFEFIVVSQHDKLIPWGDLYVHEAGSALPFNESPSYSVDGGYCSIFTTFETIELQTSFNLYRSLELRNVTQGQRIELRPWLQALIVLRDELPELPADLEYHLELTGEDEEFYYQESFDEQTLQVDGEQNWRFSKQGTCEVEFYVEQRDPGNAYAKLEWSGGQLAIQDTDEEQRFEIAVDSPEFAAALAAAIANAREQE